MQITIRKLNAGDVETLIEIARDSWKWTYGEIYSEEYIDQWIREKYSKEKLLNEVNRSQSNLDIILLGSFNESGMTGFIELKINEGNAELLRLYLKPIYTRYGMGESLLLEAEKMLRERHIVECSLFVHQRNVIAISFYKKNGFEVAEINEEDIIMKKMYE